MMNDFDEFCNNLLEEAKRFNEKAKAERKSEGIVAYNHASILLAICALEAYVNGIAEEITIAKDFNIHTKGFLLEKEVKLEKGNWILTNSLKMGRLTERIELLYFRSKRKPIDPSFQWWKDTKEGIDFRNKITHPKENITIPNGFADKVLNAVIECLSVLYNAIYKRKFPRSHLSLNSKFEF